MVPGLLFLIALAFGASPWLTANHGRRPLTIGLVLGISTAIFGAGLALPLFPWTDLVVLVIAFTGGVLLGRLFPPKLSPFIIFLVILSALDALQIVLTSGLQTPGGNNNPSSPFLYLNFLIPPPVGRFNIGIGDIILGTAVAEHWRRRRGSIGLAEVPGLAGFALADIFFLLTSYGDLPLVPFLTMGFVVAEVASHVFPGRNNHERRRPQAGLKSQATAQKSGRAELLL